LLATAVVAVMLVVSEIGLVVIKRRLPTVTLPSLGAKWTEPTTFIVRLGVGVIARGGVQPHAMHRTPSSGSSSPGQPRTDGQQVRAKAPANKLRDQPEHHDLDVTARPGLQLDHPGDLVATRATQACACWRDRCCSHCTSDQVRRLCQLSAAAIGHRCGAARTLPPGLGPA
jgi:hypothetical protein